MSALTPRSAGTGAAPPGRSTRSCSCTPTTNRPWRRWGSDRLLRIVLRNVHHLAFDLRDARMEAPVVRAQERVDREIHILPLELENLVQHESLGQTRVLIEDVGDSHRSFSCARG